MGIQLEDLINALVDITDEQYKDDITGVVSELVAPLMEQVALGEYSTY